MPSMIVSYVPGSGFVPILGSGNPWSGLIEPIGTLQLRASPLNSGAVYISLSGGNAFSGQMSTLVGSGGPTINSGAMFMSGGPLSGAMDGMLLNPGDGYSVPRLAFTTSGVFKICAGCDAACSGQARLYYEAF